ncbi:methyl-accepting chemotaxis protein [Inhella crocodyli]|uniref:Methyl-accepting chemotaxis protein n=2 Tax=Inhella crocodyli TaxID=2499851 RepID=A0A3S2WTQ2_9BURK|nr:methyl-accepting chemotaxis protein [Inhella crocodyli]
MDVVLSHCREGFTMDWFFNLVPTLRARLYAISTVMGVLMVVLVLVMLDGMSRQLDALQSVYADRVVPLRQLKVVGDSYAVSIVDTCHKVRNGVVGWEEGSKAVTGARDLLNREWKQFVGRELAPDEQKLLQEIGPLRESADRVVDEILKVFGEQDEPALVSLISRRLYQKIDPVSDKVSALVNVQLEVAKAEYEAGLARYRRNQLIAVAGLGVALAFGLGLSLLVSNRILMSLGTEPRALREAVGAIGEQDLTQALRVAPGDETSVAANVNRMQGALRDMVGLIRDGSQELRQSAEEISSGNMDLSNRTEQTASSMADAASRLREVIDRVRERASNLGHARSMVSNTRVVAEQAGVQMGEVTETMRGINESARRIGDIIGTIDGIAFQTNILALNAAVEAARAGEQGRGFAVVAGEVRALAQRSAEAAKEIKTLIGASVERVDAGARQVDGTGGTLQSMVSDIQKLAEMVGQIAGEAQQDDQDMGQVLERLNAVDQAVQQNAALVEEMAASSQSLNDQSEKLARTCAGFKT